MQPVPSTTHAADSARVGQRCRNQRSDISRQHTETPIARVRPTGPCGPNGLIDRDRRHNTESRNDPRDDPARVGLHPAARKDCRQPVVVIVTRLPPLGRHDGTSTRESRATCNGRTPTPLAAFLELNLSTSRPIRLHGSRSGSRSGSRRTKNGPMRQLRATPADYAGEAGSNVQLPIGRVLEALGAQRLKHVGPHTAHRSRRYAGSIGLPAPAAAKQSDPSITAGAEPRWFLRARPG